jgi:hypothetical protein
MDETLTTIAGGHVEETQRQRELDRTLPLLRRHESFAAYSKG